MIVEHTPLPSIQRHTNATRPEPHVCAVHRRAWLPASRCGTASGGRLRSYGFFTFRDLRSPAFSALISPISRALALARSAGFAEAGDECRALECTFNLLKRWRFVSLFTKTATTCALRQRPSDSRAGARGVLCTGDSFLRWYTSEAMQDRGSKTKCCVEGRRVGTARRSSRTHPTRDADAGY